MSELRFLHRRINVGTAVEIVLQQRLIEQTFTEDNVTVTSKLVWVDVPDVYERDLDE